MSPAIKSKAANLGNAGGVKSPPNAATRHCCRDACLCQQTHFLGAQVLGQLRAIGPASFTRTTFDLPASALATFSSAKRATHLQSDSRSSRGATKVILSSACCTRMSDLISNSGPRSTHGDLEVRQRNTGPKLLQIFLDVGSAKIQTHALGRGVINGNSRFTRHTDA